VTLISYIQVSAEGEHSCRSQGLLTMPEKTKGEVGPPLVTVGLIRGNRVYPIQV